MTAQKKYLPDTPCTECHQVLPIMGKGLCKKCYSRLWYRSQHKGISREEYNKRRADQKTKDSWGKCKTCNQVGKIQSLSQCSKCYKKTVGAITICIRCGNRRKHEAKGLCNSCYVNTVTSKRKTKNIICSICKEEKPHKAKGLCQSCYRRQHKKTWEKLDIICSECKQKAKHEANGLCMKCYLRAVNGRKYNQARNARKLGLEATLTNSEWEEILKRYNYSCAYCGIDNEPLHQEHWIPLSKGGGYTSKNIVPSCRRCNSRKHTMTGDEFIDFLKKESDYACLNEASCV